MIKINNLQGKRESLDSKLQEHLIKKSPNCKCSLNDSLLASPDTISQFFFTVFHLIERILINLNRSTFRAVSTPKLNTLPSLLFAKTCIFLFSNVSILQIQPRKICSLTMQHWHLLLKETSSSLTSSVITKWFFL